MPLTSSCATPSVSLPPRVHREQCVGHLQVVIDDSLADFQFQTLSEDFCMKVEGPVDISLLTFAIERNEAMLRAIHQAVDAV